MPKQVDSKLQSKIEDAIILFDKLVDTLPEDRKTKVKDLFNGPFADSFYCAPASSRDDYHNCHPGGLLLHSLTVLSHLKKLAVVANLDVPEETLTFAALFHDLGKAGDGENEFFVEKDSKWHREQGIFYEFNKDCLNMPTNERTLYLLQKAGIALTSDEFIAIRLCEADSNVLDFYKYREPKLALLLNLANRLAMEKENK